jgi:hypothetical protein
LKSTGPLFGAAPTCEDNMAKITKKKGKKGFPKEPFQLAEGKSWFNDDRPKGKMVVNPKLTKKGK